MDKTKKKSVKRYILWGVLALLTLWLALMPLMARQQQEEDGPKASILSANASVGSIRAAIHGGGTLEAGDPEDINIPADVKIEEFLVKNGDMVCEGDALATVDKVSVMTAITEVQSSMATVRKQMESAANEKTATEVSATAGGRVKLVYAREGDRVESVMLEHGALAVLSLDSKMCVRLTANSPLAIGEAVTVTLSDGKEVTGRVESNLIGEIVVTIEDKGYEVGQTVTVENTGTGTLEIHSPWKATAFAGTVSIAYAQPEQTLGAGAALFALKDTDYTAQRETLAQTHRDYEELLQKLFKMYESGVISAPCDGLISGIDKDSAHLMAAREEEIVAQPLNTGAGEYRLVLLSGGAICTGNGDCQLENGNPSHNPACPHACDKSENCPATTAHFAGCPHNCTVQAGCKATFHQEGCPEKCTNDDKCLVSDPTKHQETCPKRCINAEGCKATIHKDKCIERCIHANEGQDCPAENHFDDCIERCIRSTSSSMSCPASKHRENCYFNGVVYYARVFKVSAVANQELIGFYDTNTYQVVKTGSRWKRTDGQPLGASLAIQEGILPVANVGQFGAGDIVLIITGKTATETFSVGTVLHQRGTAQNFTMPSMNFNFNFSMPSMGGYGGSTSQSQLYDLVGDVLMTVTPQNTMTLTVAVDEADISSVKTGMLAEITVNALPDEVFEGEITKVAKTGSGNGGSSKFDVQITLERQGEMLAGMSASAVISLYEKMNVLTLPAAALTEEGGKTVVYTALDKKTGEPVSPVEVTTGLSDGEMVEILSGLQSGDEVYYAYFDTVEESDAVEIDRMKMY